MKVKIHSDSELELVELEESLDSDEDFDDALESLLLLLLDDELELEDVFLDFFFNGPSEKLFLL